MWLGSKSPICKLFVLLICTLSTFYKLPSCPCSRCSGYVLRFGGGGGGVRVQHISHSLNMM